MDMMWRSLHVRDEDPSPDVPLPEDRPLAAELLEINDSGSDRGGS
jgi:hypothetical protein